MNKGVHLNAHPYFFCIYISNASLKDYFPKKQRLGMSFIPSR